MCRYGRTKPTRQVNLVKGADESICILTAPRSSAVPSSWWGRRQVDHIINLLLFSIVYSYHNPFQDRPTKPPCDKHPEPISRSDPALLFISVNPKYEGPRYAPRRCRPRRRPRVYRQWDYRRHVLHVLPGEFHLISNPRNPTRVVLYTCVYCVSLIRGDVDQLGSIYCPYGTLLSPAVLLLITLWFPPCLHTAPSYLHVGLIVACIIYRCIRTYTCITI